MAHFDAAICDRRQPTRALQGAIPDAGAAFDESAPPTAEAS
jgi:hypothetical protein